MMNPIALQYFFKMTTPTSSCVFEILCSGSIIAEILHYRGSYPSNTSVHIQQNSFISDWDAGNNSNNKFVYATKCKFLNECLRSSCI